MIRTIPALALLMVTTPSLAQTSDPGMTTTVRYDDLDLTGAPGRAELDRRISGAVRAVCPESHVRELRHMVAQYHCRTVASTAAFEQRDQAVRRHSAQVLVGSR